MITSANKSILSLAKELHNSACWGPHGSFPTGAMYLVTEPRSGHIEYIWDDRQWRNQ